MSNGEQQQDVACGDLLELSSHDSRSFEGPFRAAVLDIVTLSNGKPGLVVQLAPPAYFGPDPLHMREADTFVLVARAIGEVATRIPRRGEVSVHVAAPEDWADLGRGPIDAKKLKSQAWGEVRWP